MKITEAEVQKFLQKYNNGEFNKNWRLGQTFVNYFGLSHPQCDIPPSGPCLFHLRDDGQAIKAIWEHFTEV